MLLGLGLNVKFIAFMRESKFEKKRSLFEMAYDKNFNIREKNTQKI
jgi:hypothetical protein